MNDELARIKKMAQPFEDLGMKVGEDNGSHPVHGGDSTSCKYGSDAIVWRYHGGRSYDVNNGTIVDAYMLVHGVDDKEAIKMLKQRYGTDEKMEESIKQFKEKRAEVKNMFGDKPVPVAPDVEWPHALEKYIDSQGKKRTVLYQRGPNLVIEDATSIHYLRGQYGEVIETIAVVRWDLDNSKEFRPFNFNSQEGEWQLGLPNVAVRPIYKLGEIFRRGTEEVWVVEGEKCMDALQKACDDARDMFETFPRVVVTTSVNGSKSMDKCDWATLKRRGVPVRVIPDNDSAGENYARYICGEVDGVYTIPYPNEAEKYDIADWLDEGGDVRSIKNGDFDIDQKTESYFLPEHNGDSELTRYVKATMELIYSEGEFWEYDPNQCIYRKVEEKEIWKKQAEIAGRPCSGGKPFTLSNAKQSASVSALKVLEHHKDFFEGESKGICFSNKIAVMEDGKVEVRDYRSSDKVRQKLPFHHDANATPDRWLKFLDEIFIDDEDKEDKKMALQEFIGACLFGMPTKYEKAFMLHGDGSNGKSVFMKVIAELFSNDKIAAVTPQSLGASNAEYYRDKLRGKQVNIVNEAPQSDILTSDGLKSMVTGDLMFARPPYGDVVEFRPTLGVIIAANHLSVVKDDSDGFWRRWVIINFNRKFTDAEKDRDLTKKIVHGEIPGILNWAIEGAERLYEQEMYTEPASSIASVEKWRNNANPVMTFVKEELDINVKGEWVRAKDIYARYKDWCKEAGYYSLSRGNFYTRMKRGVGINKTRRSAGMYYECKVIEAEVSE